MTTKAPPLPIGTRRGCPWEEGTGFVQPQGLNASGIRMIENRRDSPDATCSLSRRREHDYAVNPKVDAAPDEGADKDAFRWPLILSRRFIVGCWPSCARPAAVIW